MSEMDLEYIRAILKYGSITAASKKIYISQSALSQHIIRIEKKLGVEIFNRDFKPIKLTEAGIIYKKSLEDIEKLKENTLLKIEEINKLKIGELSIGSTDYQTYFFLSKVLKDFNEDYPGIKINLLEAKTNQLNTFALNGLCDFSITYETDRFDDLESINLYREDVYLAMSKENKLKNDLSGKGKIKTISAKKLAGQNIIRMKKGQNLILQYQELDKFTENSLNTVFETDSIFIAEKCVRENMGLAILPQSMLKEKKNDLIYFKLKEGLSSRTTMINYSKNHKLKTIAKIFIDRLKRYAKEEF
ncbi:MAG: LysR family transcriptional regulator [Anaerococcus obesiensis]|uniref:LysR family transcriptional regulator n=1 Tax=Anaerococcus TaxID=165779 RepID=UPI00290152E3|nr:LysR family transcriptional regulator [Anaerococcus vaginalis]MDU0944890.1 LysR family transcriptional regulator [Anaerococcus vaginalis]MDU1030412.1 LysR family transcriptional regulator [Anaerococcus vaginalis]